jgi:isoleucyl-tRNA synthetase
VNVKDIEFVTSTTGIVKKKLKPNFKLLGKKLGANMKVASEILTGLNNEQIAVFEQSGSYELKINEDCFNITLDEVEILSEDIEGWLVTSEKGLTVALDITISEELRLEGMAREMVNKIQNQRKDNQYDVTDKINIVVKSQPEMEPVVAHFGKYICNETLADNLTFQSNGDWKEYEINGLTVLMEITKN